MKKRIIRLLGLIMMAATTHAVLKERDLARTLVVLKAEISPTILNKPLIIRLGRKPSFSYYILSLGKERLT